MRHRRYANRYGTNDTRPTRTSRRPVRLRWAIALDHKSAVRPEHWTVTTPSKMLTDDGWLTAHFGDRRFIPPADVTASA